MSFCDWDEVTQLRCALRLRWKPVGKVELEEAGSCDFRKLRSHRVYIDFGCVVKTVRSQFISARVITCVAVLAIIEILALRSKQAYELMHYLSLRSKVEERFL